MQKANMYKVVINHEEQYSILPASSPTPAGFKSAGKTGTAQECLNYVKKSWKGVTPQQWTRLVNSLK